ncbi:EscU/YscU/HrcU family type III secretion system export apparatus switch protein [Oligoflexia bacterium]|nr:EscU/YscU/HrcU family type III secretion system export apparatus switch protein [Oligoflexia bacterium]
MSEKEPNNKKPRREKAVALQYTERDDLPKVLASGAGEIARQIMKLAEEHDVPVQHDQSLANMLSSLNIGADISPETFKLVAEVISFLYHTDQKWQEEHPFLNGVMVEEDED